MLGERSYVDNSGPAGLSQSLVDNYSECVTVTPINPA